MKRLTYIALTTAVASGMLYRASAAAGPASGLYEIMSGDYIECCARSGVASRHSTIGWLAKGAQKKEAGGEIAQT